jgi:hypothetical protein
MAKPVIALWVLLRGRGRLLSDKLAPARSNRPARRASQGQEAAAGEAKLESGVAALIHPGAASRGGGDFGAVVLGVLAHKLGREHLA